MLYTSYISKLNKIPDNIEKVIISRFIPKSLNINKFNNLYIMKELAPSKALLLAYKNNHDWSYYTKQFTYEMQHRKDLYDKINSLNKYLKKR